jgi:2-polyprenyl-6-hydroxyphenyl methylase/3-demethylubiquinone-9 3-methyltransferase
MSLLNTDRQLSGHHATSILYRARASHRSDELIGTEQPMPSNETTIDRDEIDRFAAQGDTWWDPDGSFRALHRLNPTRLGYIRSRLATHFHRDPASLRPFAGLRLLDVGCGGGLVAEPMTRLGFAVTGIDAEAAAIEAAREHARAGGLDIDYQVATVESIMDLGGRFDAVLALEVVEHVADRDAFLRSLAELVAPGGALIAATINRTARSFALAIVGAEYVLGWIPRGTHDWRKFVRPSELILALRRNRLHPLEISGISYRVGSGEWVLSPDVEVNYLVTATRRWTARFPGSAVGRRNPRDLAEFDPLIGKLARLAVGGLAVNPVRVGFTIMNSARFFGKLGADIIAMSLDLPAHLDQSLTHLGQRPGCGHRFSRTRYTRRHHRLFDRGVPA